MGVITHVTSKKKKSDKKKKGKNIKTGVKAQAQKPEGQVKVDCMKLVGRGWGLK